MRCRALMVLPLLVAVALQTGTVAATSAHRHEAAGSPEAPGPHLHESHPPARPGRTAAQAREVEIVLRNGAYRVLKGGLWNGTGLSLVAGEETLLTLRNEDNLPHDFISPLFTRTEIHFSGQATGIFRKEAAGFRLPPGQSLSLRFRPPFSDFSAFYDLLWCSRHEDHGGNGKELLIVVTNDRERRS